MKQNFWRTLKNFIFIFIFLSLVILFFNITVTTRQGINYELQVKKIPLYLKLSRFIVRDFEMRFLVKTLTHGVISDEQKIQTLFHWVVKNIRHQPDELPVIDDHQWSIIERGYGKWDQLNDVFSVLTYYLGAESFFHTFKSNDGRRHPLSFVFVNKKWAVFDVCHQTFFEDQSGKWASLELIQAGDIQVKTVSGHRSLFLKDYYHSLLGHFEIDDDYLTRNSSQKPFKRIWMVFSSFL